MPDAPGAPGELGAGRRVARQHAGIRDRPPGHRQRRQASAPPLPRQAFKEAVGGDVARLAGIADQGGRRRIQDKVVELRVPRRLRRDAARRRPSAPAPRRSWSRRARPWRRRRAPWRRGRRRPAARAATRSSGSANRPSRGGVTSTCAAINSTPRGAQFRGRAFAASGASAPRRRRDDDGPRAAIGEPARRPKPKPRRAADDQMAAARRARRTPCRSRRCGRHDARRTHHDLAHMPGALHQQECVGDVLGFEDAIAAAA